MTSLLPPAENGTTIMIVFGICRFARERTAVQRPATGQHEQGEAVE
jgi:hypothetical protein